MIQNFDMQFFRDNSDLEPVKLSIGAMTLNEILKMYNLSQKYSNAEQYIINIDLRHFNTNYSLNESSSTFPDYLYNENKVDDIKYLLGYETWFRYIPVNFAINIVKKADISLPQKFEDEIKIDQIQAWSSDFVFGKEIVKYNYFNSDSSASEMNADGLYLRMINNIDDFLKKVIDNKDVNQKITFGFPPYSALYWYTIDQNNVFEILLDAKEYFILQCLKHENIRVVDLQSIEEINDLDFYLDPTHFNLDIQKKYAEAIISDNYDIEASDITKNRLKLSNQLNQFVEENESWLK